MQRARRSRTIRGIAVLLLGLVAGAATGCTASPTASPTSAQPTESPAPTSSIALDWAPADSGLEWGEPEVTIYTPAQLGTCSAGTKWRWFADAEVTAVIVFECPDAGTAAEVITSDYKNYRLPPATDIPPALGDGVDTAVRFPSGEIDREWVQGTTLYVVAAGGCSARDCVAATARYAESLSAAVDGALHPWLPAVASPDDSFARFSPAPASHWALVGDSTTGSRVPDCASVRSRTWVSDDGLVASASTLGCASSEQAFAAFTSLWGAMTPSPNLAGALRLGPGYDSAGTYGAGAVSIGVGRAWVQGSSYVYVERICPTDRRSACEDATADDAYALASAMPGRIVYDDRVLRMSGSLAFVVFVLPVAVLAGLSLLRWGLLLRARGYTVEPARAGFTAVDARVRPARRQRAVRRIILIAATGGVWIAGVFLLAQSTLLVPFGLWLFFAPIVLGVVFSVLLRRLWHPDPLLAFGRARGRMTPLRLLGVALRAAAWGISLLAPLVYLLTGILLALRVQSQNPANIRQEIANGFASGRPLSWTIAALEQFALFFDERGATVALFALFIVLPLTAAYLLDRLGLRFSQQSLSAAVSQDARPYFLYLRGFEEDRLRVIPSLTRRGFIETLTPFGRPRFEEVLARYLGRFGPVIAIAGGHSAVPEIGAAKQSFGGGEWQERVREWMGGSLAVVMAVTPREVRRGLAWEIEQLARREHPPRIMLVLAPWPRRQLVARWAGFLGTAAQWELFAPLRDTPFPSGVHVLTWTEDAGWRGYGARRRWDWTYAASLLAAVEDAAPVWHAGRGRELSHAGEPSAPAGAGRES